MTSRGRREAGDGAWRPMLPMGGAWAAVILLLLPPPADS